MSAPLTRTAIAQRIDAILLELSELRRAVLEIPIPPAPKQPTTTPPLRPEPRPPARRFTPSTGYPPKPRTKGAYQQPKARRGPGRTVDEFCPDCAFPPGVCARHGRGAA